MSKTTPTEAHLTRLRAQVSKTKRLIRSQRNAEALAQELATMGGKVLSPSEVGYLKNHLPPHIGEAILRAIATAKGQAKQPGKQTIKDRTKKDRQRAAKRAAGLVPATVWVRPEHIDAVKALASSEAPATATAAEDAPIGAFFEDYHRTTLHGQIQAWFRDVQTQGRPEVDLIAEAACLHNRMDDEDRSDFCQYEPIEGRFIIRIIDSWAKRTPQPERVVHIEGVADDRQALRAAIRAVPMEKAGLATEAQPPV